MRKNIKKIVAGILSATMLLSTSAIAFADNLTSGGTNSNSSKVEGFVSTDVFKVVVPTSVAADTFKFIIDPQQLIAKTNADAYAGLNSGAFESGATVFFMNSGAGNLMSDAAGTGTYTYSHYSNKLTVTNKSTMAVNVNLSATITSAGNLTFANSSTFGENDTAAKVYLGIKKVGDDTSTAITAAGGTSTSLLSGAPDDAYDYFYSGAANPKYSYDLTAAAKEADYEGFAEMKFYVEGVANPNGDFSAVTSATPVLNMTWTVTPSASSSGSGSSGSGASLSASTISATSNSVTVSNGTVSTVVLNKTNGTQTTLGASHYTFSSGTLTFIATSMLQNNVGATITVSFAGGGTATLTINS